MTDSYNSSSPRIPRVVGVLIVLFFLAVSAFIYFFFTRGKITVDDPKTTGSQIAADTGPGQKSDPKSSPGDDDNPSRDPAAGDHDAAGDEIKKSDPPPKPAPPRVFREPTALASEIAGKLESGESKMVLDLVDAKSLPKEQVDRLKMLVEHGHFKLDPDEPVSPVGRNERGQQRYAINLSRPKQGPLPAEEKRLFVDVEKDPQKGWSVASIHIPEFTALKPEADSETSPVTTAKPGQAAAPDAQQGTDPADPAAKPMPRPRPKLQVVTVAGDPAAEKDPMIPAYDFLDALTSQDFAKARQYLDPSKVSEEKLVGLFIVAEDGGFRPNKKTPLVATSTSANHAIMIAQVSNGKIDSEFGLQMEHDAVSHNWRITDIALSKIIASLAESSGADGLPYTPIVSDPRGGESLVIYFHYNTPLLHERAERQLNIIAAALKSDPVKTIQIDGHADAKGSNGFNTGLSDDRAGSVREMLTTLGVNPEQIITRAFGESRPFRPNVNPDGTDNPDGRKYNRRTEVYLDF